VGKALSGGRNGIALATTYIHPYIHRFAGLVNTVVPVGVYCWFSAEEFTLLDILFEVQTDRLVCVCVCVSVLLSFVGLGV
jgi:hypothetical protein